MSELVITAQGLVHHFHAARLLDMASVQVAQTSCRLAGDQDELLVLAVAFAAQQVELGSACVDLPRVREDIVRQLADAESDDPEAGVDLEALKALPWPDPQAWLAHLASREVVGGPEAPANAHPFRLCGTLFYLERWWAFEEAVARTLQARQELPAPAIDGAALTRALDALFDGKGLDAGEPDLQREAAEAAATGWTTVIAGGPGTGKTSTVARALSVLQQLSDRPLTVALAAPSGKAAARLEQSVRLEADERLSGHAVPPLPAGQTLHRLLGTQGVGNGFTRGRHNPLPHDVVVVDEVSMVDLPMFARLLESLRPTTRLIVLGDPSQLNSVDAGRVLADLATAPLTRGPADPRSALVTLQHNWRNTGSIDQLARAVRAGDVAATRAALEQAGDDVEWINAPLTRVEEHPGLRASVVAQGQAVHTAARAGDADAALTALDQHRLLCAHREGTFGVSHWSREVHQVLTSEIPGFGVDHDEWYLGRPILVTANSRSIDVFNGDAGVIVATDRGPRLAIGDPGRSRLLAPSLVDGTQTLHAMTVHKSQGSQFVEVTVVLPPPDSPLLTREMLYTAITRAQHRLRLVGSWDAIAAAVSHDTRRASGLAARWEQGWQQRRVDADDPAPF